MWISPGCMASQKYINWAVHLAPHGIWATPLIIKLYADCTNYSSRNEKSCAHKVYMIHFNSLITSNEEFPIPIVDLKILAYVLPWAYNFYLTLICTSRQAIDFQQGNILVNILMSKLEHGMLSTVTQGMPFYRRYMDDILNMFCLQTWISVADCLNETHSTLHFTAEEDADVRSQFLDVV